MRVRDDALPGACARKGFPQLRGTLKREHPFIRAAESSIHGRGVYARVVIPDGTRIVEYTGERITKAEAKRRELQRLARARRGGDGSVYIFDLNRRYDLDGRKRTNIARLINHSCSPNCRAETIRGRIFIFARREIPAGAELTFDYGYSYKEARAHPCRCGTKACAGFIVNAGQRKRLRRALRAERTAQRMKPEAV
jgi:SET domain-containing protein